MEGEQEKHIVVIAGPSGSGKNSILSALLQRCPRTARLITATTRPPRPGEKDGVDYHFLTEEVFLEALKNGEILEHRYVPELGTHYGVYRPALEQQLQSGRVLLAHVDIIGARYLKEHYDAATIFIMPSHFEELEGRVRARSSEISEEELEERLKIAKRELDEHSPEYDHIVVNANGKLNEAVDEIVAILEREGYTLDYE